MAHYFAFDWDMDPDRVLARCPGAKRLRIAKLPYYRPDFIEYEGAAGTVLDLVPDEKKEVWGVLYFLPDIEVPGLDRAAEKGKTRRLMPVWDTDNRTYAGHVFTSDQEGKIVPPDKEVHAKILNLVRMNELPDKYYEALNALKPK